MRRLSSERFGGDDDCLVWNANKRCVVLGSALKLPVRLSLHAAFPYRFALITSLKADLHKAHLVMQEVALFISYLKSTVVRHVLLIAEQQLIVVALDPNNDKP